MKLSLSLIRFAIHGRRCVTVTAISQVLRFDALLLLTVTLLLAYRSFLKRLPLSAAARCEVANSPGAGLSHAVDRRGANK